MMIGPHAFTIGVLYRKYAPCPLTNVCFLIKNITELCFTNHWRDRHKTARTRKVDIILNIRSHTRILPTENGWNISTNHLCLSWRQIGRIDNIIHIEFQPLLRPLSLATVIICLHPESPVSGFLKCVLVPIDRLRKLTFNQHARG